MVLKTYKELKTHYYEESKYKVVGGDKYNDENDEFVYYSLMEISSAKNWGWNGGWG